MSRIGASISGFERLLLNRLSEANSAAALSTLRLATGKIVNSPSENPAAFFQVSSLENRLSIVKSTLSQVSLASSVGASTQLSVASIRTQLDTIRTSLLLDEGLGLSTAQRATEQATIDAALDQINVLAGTEINGRRLLDGSVDFRTSGVNATQIRDVQVFSVGGGGQVVAQEKAELVYTGSNRQITNDGNITITGSIGQSTIAVNQNDALTDVAATINGLTTTTGVSAVADGDTLTLTSVNYGSDALAKVTVNSGVFSVSGGDGAGTDFGVDQLVSSQPAFSGSVLTAAEQATLLYTGAAGQTTAAADFTLTGALGSTTISVANNEDLTDVADRINQFSHDTGITASVNADELTFTTVDFGTDATIAISVTSGAFGVTGGNEDGTAQGVNAIVEINGEIFSGNKSAATATLNHTELTGQLQSNADIRLTGNLGFFDFSFTSGTTLAVLAATIDAEKATTGVEASVSADGFDLVLSSTTDGSAGSVSVEVDSGVFSVTAQSDSSVATDADAQPGRLTYSTSDGLVIANATFNITGDVGGPSAIVVTAGQTLAAVAVLINAETGTTGVQATVDGNDLVIYSQNTGEAAFADLDVTAGAFDVSGGDAGGRAFGTDEITVVEGVDPITNKSSVKGNRVIFNNNGLHFNVEFAAGFTGSFDTVAISDQTTLKFALTTDASNLTTLGLSSLQTLRLGGLSGFLSDLKSGGSLSGLSTNTSQAIRVVDEAIAQLSLVEGQVDGFTDASVASSSGLLTSFQSTLEDAIDDINKPNTIEEELLILKNNALADNIISSLSILSSQRASIVNLIKQIAGL